MRLVSLIITYLHALEGYLYLCIIRM